jgi:tungstate transport system substrate-binding protein
MRRRRKNRLSTKAGYSTVSPFMYNDYVFVGPATDPAQVGAAQSAAEVLKRIADRQALFVSRGDQSGTHKQEQALWQTSSLTPKGG